jgi:hypothetical protein
MPRYYITHSCPETSPNRNPFFSTDSANIADRLVKLLTTSNPGFRDIFAKESPPDEDSEILWDDSIEHIDVLSKCGGDFGVFDFEVPESQRKLVGFYWDCERWEDVIRARERSQPQESGPFYIALSWFDEGYSGQRPVYRVADREMAEQLRRAANTRFSNDPQDVVESGAGISFDALDAAKVPSRLVWDIDLQKLSDAVSSGNRDDDAGIYAACAEWETAIRKQMVTPQKETTLERPTGNTTVALGHHTVTDTPKDTSRNDDDKKRPAQATPSDWRQEILELLKDMADFLRSPFHRVPKIVEGMANGDATARGLLEVHFKLAEALEMSADYVAAALTQIPSEERQPVFDALAVVKAECDAVRRTIGPAFKANTTSGKWLIKCDTDPSQPKRGSQLIQIAIDRLVALQLSGIASGDRTNIAKIPNPYSVLSAVTVFNGGITDFAHRQLDENDRSDLDPLYAPLEQAGYAILAAASSWKLPTPRLSELLEKCRLEGIPLRSDFAVHANDYQYARGQELARFLNELAGEIAAVKHRANLACAAQPSVSEITVPNPLAAGILDALNTALVLLQNLRLAERETHAPMSGGGEEWHFDNPSDEHRVRAAQSEMKSLNVRLRGCFDEIAVHATAQDWDLSSLSHVLDCPSNHVALLPTLIDDAEVCLRGILSKTPPAPASNASAKSHTVASNADIPDGFYSPNAIARAIKAPEKSDAIRMALKRLLDESRLPDGAWMENNNPAKGQAKILYKLFAVRPFLSRFELPKKQ